MRCCCRHKGHTQLAIRGSFVAMQGCLSLLLAIYGVDIDHMFPTALAQFVSGMTLLTQWRTAWDSMFAFRACASIARAFVVSHLAVCGRFSIGGSVCDVTPWTRGDLRSCFRVLHVVAVVRLCFNGHSLLSQFAAPAFRTRADRGHDQLRRRACIRLSGVPIHFLRAGLKVGLLTGTRYERSQLEIIANVVRAVVFIPIEAWSLYMQWYAPPRVGRASSAAAQTDPLNSPAPLAGERYRYLGTFVGLGPPTEIEAQLTKSTVCGIDYDDDDFSFKETDAEIKTASDSGYDEEVCLPETDVETIKVASDFVEISSTASRDDGAHKE